MNELVTLKGAEPRKILQAIIDTRTPAIMSYLSRGKWHIAKAQLTRLGASRLDIEVATRRKPNPINVQINQAVGLSLKYGYGKFMFDSVVQSLEPSPDGGGIIVLGVPDRIEMVQRRSYFRVTVPRAMEIGIGIWHRVFADGQQGGEPENCWHGRLVDISAGGAQLVIDSSQNPDFRSGQFIGVKFIPMPDEPEICFNAQIRNILPTADGQAVSMGVQVVGLEANAEGRQVLARLVGVVERYYQINQSGAKGQDMEVTRVQRHEAAY